MSKFLRTLLFLGALSPVTFSFAYLNFQKNGCDVKFFQLVIIGFLGCMLPILIIKALIKQGEELPIIVKKVESNDFIFVAFLCSYILPVALNGFDFDIEKIILFTIFAGLILWFTSDLPTHPLLRILKFKFYKIESSKGLVYILITKRKIKSPDQIKIVKKISESMLLDTGA